jgi:hypothetical protein
MQCAPADQQGKAWALPLHNDSCMLYVGSLAAVRLGLLSPMESVLWDCTVRPSWVLSLFWGVQVPVVGTSTAEL